MATNREIVTAALRMLGVLDADETAATEDATLGLEELNDLMASLAADEIDLGFPPQESLADEFPLDEQAAAQIKPLLAIHLHAHYPSSQPSQALLGRAEGSRRQLLRAAVTQNMQEAVTALPLGNAWGGGYYDIDTGE
jgi:hypothetical protein